MKRLVSSFIAALAVWMSGSGAAMAHVDEAAFDHFMASHLRATGIPGMAVVVVGKGGVELLKGYGHDADGRPIDPQSRFMIGSLAKSFTALAVMQLVEAGRVSLDDPVRRHVPDFRLADPRGERITVRMLLEQTSGMDDSTYFEWTLRGPATLAAAVDRLHTAGLAREPGAAFAYHNPNFEVAARLVEIASGEPYADYLRVHVLAPLGMTHTTTVDRLDDASAPTGHVRAFGRAWSLQSAPFFLGGAGGVVTNAADMASWLVAQQNEGVGVSGVRVLSATGMRAMHTATHAGSRYALGWYQSRAGDPPEAYHMGWTPTFTAYQSVSLDGGDSFAVLSNAGRSLTNGSAAGYVSFGIRAAQSGRAIDSKASSTLLLDAVLALFSLGVLVSSIRSVRRARAWAGVSPTARSVLPGLLGPAIAVLVAFLILVYSGSVVSGRSLPLASALQPGLWVWTFFILPTGAVALAIVIGGRGAVLIARVAAVRRSFRKPTGG